MRRSLRVSLVVVMAATLAGVTAGPANAGLSFLCQGTASTAPDGAMKLAGESFIGQGSYANLGLTEFFGNGGQATALMKWRNVSTTTRVIRVIRSDANSFHSPGFSARYFLNGVDITNQMKHSNGLKFSGIAPQQVTPVVSIVIKNKSGGDFNIAEEYLLGRYRGAGSTTCDGQFLSVNDGS